MFCYVAFCLLFASFLLTFCLPFAADDDMLMVVIIMLAMVVVVVIVVVEVMVNHLCPILF